MEQAEKGIRFIGPHYKELFRIPDGGQIRILREGCAPIDRTCRYIDDCHVEVGNGWDSLFHICQFAEQMERCHNEVIPLTPPLPEKCFTVQPSSGELIAIERVQAGVSGVPHGLFQRENAPADGGCTQRRYGRDQGAGGGNAGRGDPGLDILCRRPEPIQ